jgi:hypothetical protein
MRRPVASTALCPDPIPKRGHNTQSGRVSAPVMTTAAAPVICSALHRRGLLIRLDAYNSAALDHLARVGAWALYVIRPARSKMPVKIGRTTDPHRALIEAARRSPVPLEMAYLFWTCGRPLAERIERVVREQLTADGKRAETGWHRITADEAAQRIEATARLLYPTVTSFLDHAGMVEQIERRGRRMMAVRPQPRM